jgi:hypothetical protein
MFYSFKDLPIVVTGNNSGYQFNAQNIKLTINPNLDFSFKIGDKRPFRSIASQGLTTTIALSYLAEIPKENIFLNNIVSPSGQKYFYTLCFGSGIFESGYLRSYSFEVVPNSIVRNNLEFVFYSTGSGFNPNLITNLQSNNPSWQLDQYGITGRNTSAAEDFSFKLWENNNLILDTLSGEVLNFNFDYKADINAVYRMNESYPYRVLYNKEEINLNTLFNYSDYIMMDSNTNYSGLISLKNLNNTNLSSNISLNSGYLVNKDFDLKSDSVINTRISLKYYI